MKLFNIIENIIIFVFLTLGLSNLLGFTTSFYFSFAIILMYMNIIYKLEELKE